LEGCGLPQAWAGRRRFTVGELGFGVGLNVLALVQLWLRTRPDPASRLHIFSVEGYPLTAQDAGRALGRWPELAALAAPLLKQWPGRRRGFHRVHFEAAGVLLDVAVMEVEAALSAWDGRADAWFLDGFAPSKNPEMWTPAVMGALAARSAPGAAAASFSVAGAVRAALGEAGFVVTREVGYGRKAERLTARYAPAGAARPDPAPLRPPNVVIIGAGIAGAAIAWAVRRLGGGVDLLEASAAGDGASRHPAALVSPRFDAGLGQAAELYAEAFARAVAVYRRECPLALIAEGALRLAIKAQDERRYDAVSRWIGFEPGALSLLSAAEAAERLGEAPGLGAMGVRDALVIEPAAVLEALGGRARIGRAGAIEVFQEGWRILLEDGSSLLADAVVLASGAEIGTLYPEAPIRPVRGQVSLAPGVDVGAPASWGGYAIPTREGVLFGATHDRDDTGLELRAEDHQRNLSDLARARPGLAQRVAEVSLQGRAAVRASTRDHLPLAGRLDAAAPLFILAGLGGRGFTLAPLLAEALAAEIMAAPPAMPRSLWAAVAPERPSLRPRPAGQKV
jgi:tRNA 5-methylaminomethyl-2-thiouridine biosynthesis bifunctional protein